MIAHDDKRENLRDEIREQVQVHSSLSESLTALPTKPITVKKTRPLIVPTTNTLKTTAEVGREIGEPEGKLGIDYLEMRFPFTRFVEDPECNWKQRYPRPDVATNGRWEVWLPLNPEWAAAGARMSAHVWGTTRWCTVGFNPSTVLWGPGTVSLASVDQALALAESVFSVAIPGQVLTPERFDLVKLTRLDVAMHVDQVANPEFIYEWYVRNPHYHLTKYIKYFKGSRCTGVDHRRSCSDGSRIYPKKTVPRSQGAILRFEAQARKKTCELYVPRIRDLSEVAISKVFGHYFKFVAEGLSMISDSPLEVIVNDERYRRTMCQVVSEKLLTRAGILTPQHRGGTIRRELKRIGACDAVDQLIDNHWV